MIPKIEIDIIILSYAYNKELKQTTIDAINSLITSEDSTKINFNIIIIESQQELNDYQYAFSKTVYPETPFGYHRYMNIGIDLTSSPYICLCNNDLIFHKGWASEILKYMEEIPDLVSASPICSIGHPFMGIQVNSGIQAGYRIGYEIAGWCLFLKREILLSIGILDENYRFSGADHDYANTLAVMNLKHALITTSIVDHAYSKTLMTQSKERQDELTKDIIYNVKKWNHRLLP